MKFCLLKSVGLLAAVMCATPTCAYIYSFSNHDYEALKVRIQLAGIKEPWYEAMLPAGGYWEFRFVGGEGSWDDMRKVGFCLQNIQMAVPRIKKVQIVDAESGETIEGEEVVRDEFGNIVWGPWAAVVVKWVENEGFNSILSAAEKFASSLGTLAKEIAKGATGMP
jgi:hypothetical protein